MAKDCRDTALTFLEHRERSTREVREHLKAKGFSADEITETLEYLSELHYLDEGRYCSNLIRYGMSKGKGPLRLQQELKEKGVGTEYYQSALEEAFGDGAEKAAAAKEAGKILDRNEQIDEKTLAKAARRLASLGYHTSIIYEVVGRFRNHEKLWDD